MFALGDRLGKTVSELERLPLREINEWFAYFKIEGEMKDGRHKS